MGRAQALDGGMKSDHGLSHGVAGWIGIKATEDLHWLLKALKRLGSHRGLGLAPAVEIQRYSGLSAQQLMASIADSQRMMAEPEAGPISKKPRSF